MKTPTNTNTILGISALLLACTVLLLSCGGCRSGKVSPALPDIAADTVRVVKPPVSTAKQDHYPRIDSIDNIVYVNDSTKIINNVRVTYSPDKNETSLLLPNGVIMSSNEKPLLLNKIPKAAFKKDQYNYSYIDLRLVSPNIKQKLFGHMSTAESIKMENLKGAGYDYNIRICGKNNNFICKRTTLYVFGHDSAEGDYDGWGVGQIGYTEIYNLNGKKILDLNRNKNGGNLKLLNDSLNLIIYYREGDDEGNFYGYLWPVIDVYEFATGKHLYEIRTLGYGGDISLKEGKICAISGHLKEGGRCFYIIDYKNGQIYFYKYKYGEAYAWSIENDNLILSDGNKTPINNTDKVLKMSIDDWNKFAMESLSE